MRTYKRVFLLTLVSLILTLIVSGSAWGYYCGTIKSGGYYELGTIMVTGYNKTHNFSKQLQPLLEYEGNYKSSINFDLPNDGSIWEIVANAVVYEVERSGIKNSYYYSFSKTITTSGVFTGPSIKQAVDAANNAATKANDAYNKAEDASVQATSAKTSADSAKSAANNAKTAAENAYNKANSNNSILSDSSKGLYKTYEKAESARAQASAATTAANNAKTAANNAYSKAESARAQAATATTAANNAKTSADSAKTAANNAYNKAESARAQAATATTAANNAKTAASTASSRVWDISEGKSAATRDKANTASSNTSYKNNTSGYWSYYGYSKANSANNNTSYIRSLH